MTFGDAAQIYRDKLDVNPDLKPKSKYYYRLALEFILFYFKSYPTQEVRGFVFGVSQPPWQLARQEVGR